MKQCRRERTSLPTGYAKLAIPAGPLLSSYKSRPNWGLRMSARAMMEKDNLLQLARIKELLNPALPASQKLWLDLAPTFIALDCKRLTGVRAATYNALGPHDRAEARKKASAAVLRRLGVIVQRRHDVVHNCDRPKNAPQPMKPGSAKNVLTDLKSFVDILDAHLDAHRVY